MINIFLNILLFVFLECFIFSLIKIYYWYNDNQDSSKVFDSIKNNIEVNDDDGIFKIDFVNLKKRNSDTIAFLKVYGTNIEYPIVKTDNNEFYLTHSFDKSVNEAGWPFVNYVNKFDDTDKNITIFAHSRKDGSMFGTLYKTLSSKWQKNKDNLKILLITESDTYFYQVFSTYKVLAEDYYIMNSFDSDGKYKEFLDKIKGRSNYKYNVDLDDNDSIITLSTCASDDKYRIVLHAKKIVNMTD